MKYCLVIFFIVLTGNSFCQTAITFYDRMKLYISNHKQEMRDTLEVPAIGHTHDYSNITGKPTLFDGVYSSLTGKPTLFDGAYSTLTGKPDLTLKVNVSDSAAMLANYKAGLVAIPTKAKYTDTAAMLSNYLTGLIQVPTKVKYTDTTAMLAAYLTNLIAKVKYSDTTAMLANYLTGIIGVPIRVKYTDTASMLSNYKTATIAATAGIPLKVNISDTATMLANYKTAMIAQKGYTISVQALTSGPTDAQTIFFGNQPKAPTSTAAQSKVYIRKAGTIKIAEIYSFATTAGTNEAWVMSIRVNNTTDTQIASVAVSAGERIWSNTGLNIAVAAGDYIEIKSVNPTWSTNPLAWIVGGYLYIE